MDGLSVGVAVTGFALEVGQGVLMEGKVAVMKASVVGCVEGDRVDEQAVNKITNINRSVNRFILSPKQVAGPGISADPDREQRSL